MVQHNFPGAQALCNWLLLGLCCLAPFTQAGDLSRDVRKGAQGPDTGNGGYLEVGLGTAAYTSQIYEIPKGNSQGEVHIEAFVDISARYQYRGWFAELFSQGLHEFTLGYNFYNSDGLAFDWVGRSEHSEISEEQSREYQGLHRRRLDFLSGPRATVYLDNYILQMHALTDVSGTHDGQLYSLNVARYWQYRNWNIHAIVGATYRSSALIDYYFSIDETEASERFPAVNLNRSMAYVVELGLTYPLSEKWVWRGFVRRIDIDSGATRSPLILSNHGEDLAISLNYVF